MLYPVQSRRGFRKAGGAVLMWSVRGASDAAFRSADTAYMADKRQK